MNKLALLSAKELSKSESCLNPEQLQVLLKRTPAQYVRKRPAKGGGEWQYVTGGYVKKVLNVVFGFRWSFEIVDEMVNIEAAQCIVKGRLTVHTDKGDLVKMQYGRQDIKMRKGTDKPLDLGNDLKGAATDALKKCAAELGVASDIYNAEEFREVDVKEVVESKEEEAALRMIQALEPEELRGKFTTDFLEKYPTVKAAFDAKVQV